MEKVKAIVSISVSCDCPKCGETVDLTEQENDLFDGNTLPNPNRTDNNYIYYCDKCHFEFIVDELEY